MITKREALESYFMARHRRMGLYPLHIQMFADEPIIEDETGDKGGSGEGSVEDDDKNKNTSISMTAKQLEERLARERKKAKDEADRDAESRIATMISEALKAHDEEIEKKKSFDKMTEEEREEALRQEREENLKKRESELQEKIKKIEISNAKNIIMSNYDKDQLPRRDLFEPIAEFMAHIEDESDKVTVYNSLKAIIEDVKKSMMKEAMKQNPPRDGDTDASTFKSSKYAKDINEREKLQDGNKSDTWGKAY